jgi:hypothetical protein
MHEIRDDGGRMSGGGDWDAREGVVAWRADVLERGVARRGRETYSGIVLDAFGNDGVDG